MSRALLSLLIICALMSVFVPASSRALHTQRQITIGIIPVRSKADSIPIWQPLAAHLRRSMPGTGVRIVFLDRSEMEEAVSRNQLDFVVINPAYYIQLREKLGLSGVLATLVEQENGKHVQAFGGVIFTGHERSDIEVIQDLKEKKIAIVDKSSLGGYQAQAYELALAGLKLSNNEKIMAVGFPQDNVITAVLEGRSDAGFVRAGVLEMMAAEKRLDLRRIKILNKQKLADFPFAVSTQLYPQWPFVALPHVKEELTRQVAAALLTMSQPDAYTSGIHGFTIPANYHAVEEMLRALRLPPYDITPSFSTVDVLKKYFIHLLIFGLAGIVVIILLIFLAVANRRLATARAEAAESAGNYRDLLDLAPLPIGISAGNGSIIYVNNCFKQLFGYEPEEIPTVAEWMRWAYPDEKLRPELEERWNSAVKQARASGAPLQQVEYKVACKDGTQKVVEISAMPIANNLLVLFNDITERKQAEEERLRLEKQLLHTQKLESLGVLAGGIAHDFNNILMAVIGNADLALMRVAPESPAANNLREIEKAAGRAADLARQMLAYSGKGSFVIERIDLNRLLEDMTSLLQTSISKMARLNLQLTRPLPAIEGDATQIRQIIMNLTINASEAIGDQEGVITISTGIREMESSHGDGLWFDETLPAGRYVTLEIADSGCGMDHDTLAKIFEPFFTTKFIGRGLGMSAVQGIVRGHKGSIKVYSEPGRGSIFRLLFPSSDMAVEGIRPQGKNDEWRGRGTVLLVDDEEAVLGVGRVMLRELGFEVITAPDGKAALSCYRENPGIAFVILDLTMPRMDGAQCFHELRQMDPNVRVIISSGFNEQDVSEKFAGRGLAGFIQKPYKLSELRDVIKGIATRNQPDNSSHSA